MTGPFGQIGAVSIGSYLGDPSGMLGLANTLVGDASSAASQIISTAGGFAPPVVSSDFGNPITAPTLMVGAVPDFASAIWVSPAIPEAFSETLSIEDVIPEPFDVDPPTLAFGTAPTPITDTIPEAPAITLAFDDPTLQVNLPSPPDLLAINVRPFDGINLPTLDATAPTLDIVAPSVTNYTPGGAYSSALLTQMSSTLESWIRDGGTGISPDVENAIWDRGREREARSQREAIERLEQMEALGYNLPPGVYADARVRIITETDYAERGHSREVMIEAARLEQSNVQKAFDSAVQLEARLIEQNNAVEQRLFESTKYATEAGISIYNARVEAFGRLTQVYTAKVQAYEALVRAETTKVEQYKALVDAERAKATVNTALVEQYKAQADVAIANVRVFEAEIAGIQAKADIEKTKIMIFGEQVRAYASKVNAYTAGVEGFRASIEAEGTKQRAYQSQVDAFSARVTAASKLADIRIAAYRGRIDAKTAEIEQYRATVQGESARIQGIVSGNQTLAEAYRAEVSGLTSFNDSLTKQWQVAYEQAQRTAEIGVSVAKANAELYVTGRSLATDAAKVSAQVMAQLGAAALNTVNWSNSISKSYSAADSVSASYSESSAIASSRSNSEAVSTSYNYNYSESASV